MLAADKKQVSGNIVSSSNCVKITEIDGVYIAGAGKLCEIYEFIEFYKGDGNRSPDLSECQILVIEGRKVAIANQSESGAVHLIPYDVPCAVGSGGQIALGAMLKGASAEEAIKLTSKVDIYTNAKVQVYQL